MHFWQRVLLVIILFISIYYSGNTQTKDSLPNSNPTVKKVNPVKPKTNTNTRDSILTSLPKDSLQLKKDSVAKIDSVIVTKNKSIPQKEGYYFLQEVSLLGNEPFINKIMPKKPIMLNNDGLFYVLAFIVLILAIVKLAFPKHLVNVFSIFFQTIYRQKQTKDQLLQDKLAHFGLMLVFFASTSVFVTTLLIKNHIFSLGFWQLLTICFLLLIGVYSLKYIFVQALGLLFKQQEASTTYIFLVFLINKLIGVLLIPAIILISFSTASISQVALLFSYCAVSFLLLYRVFLTYKSVNSRLNINIFQFFLYFCGVEILPLLLIYKTSIMYWQQV